MAFPKALLCCLGQGETQAEEAALRAVGFAVGSVDWAELNAQPRGWMELAPLLEEAGMKALVVAGRAEEFTTEVLSCVTMFTLALTRPLLTVFLVRDAGGDIDLPPLLQHVRLVRGPAWAAKVMALRQKPLAAGEAPFHLRAHLSPFTGLWLEMGPEAGTEWKGFMVGVTGAEIGALGVGPRGQVPLRCTLHYPQLGILGEVDGQPFYACAAHNTLDEHTVCYVRVDGYASALFVASAPDVAEDTGEADMPPLCVDLA